MSPAIPIIAAAAACAFLAYQHTAPNDDSDAQDTADQPDISPQDTGNSFTEVIQTTQSAMQASSQASANVQAFLKTIRVAEGTEKANNPYAVVYAYAFTITDFSAHPAELGWRGVPLSAAMCANAGLSNGCVSTAAGAYQFIKPTWRSMGQPDFSPHSQDAACIKMLARLGALRDVENGNLTSATAKCAGTWASLPGNTYRQGGKTLQQVAQIYQSAGGAIV